MGYEGPVEIQCDGKVKHLTKDTAKREARLLAGRGRSVGRTRLEVYRCGHCGWWHVGHRPAFKHRRA